MMGEWSTWQCMGLPKGEALRETRSLQVADTTNTRLSHYNYKSLQRPKDRPLETGLFSKLETTDRQTLRAYEAVQMTRSLKK